MSTFNFKVNDKVANEGCGLHEFIIITAIGEGYFLGKRNTEHFGFSEEIWNKSLDWLPYTPPKKTVRMAPALTKALIPFGEARAWSDGGKQLTGMYENENTAKLACGDGFIKWPASENLWVDVPVEE